MIEMTKNYDEVDLRALASTFTAKSHEKVQAQKPKKKKSLFLILFFFSSPIILFLFFLLFFSFLFSFFFFLFSFFFFSFSFLFPFLLSSSFLPLFSPPLFTAKKKIVKDEDANYDMVEDEFSFMC